MAKSEKNPELELEDEQEEAIRSQLARRLAVAGSLVVLLLGGLVFFDYLTAPSEELDMPVFTKPVPVGPKRELSQAVTPTNNLPDPPQEAQPEAAPVPVEAAPPAVQPVEGKKVEAPPVPHPAAVPSPRVDNPPVRPATVDKPVRIIPPPMALPAAPRREAAAVAAAPEMTRSPAMTPARSVEPPVARVVQTTPAVTQPAINRLFSGFLLQSGMFTSLKRAEEVHAQLVLSGVPSTLETKVQVGPFRTRQEAEAAQEKLREMGITTVLVAPKGARH